MLQEQAISGETGVTPSHHHNDEDKEDDNLLLSTTKQISQTALDMGKSAISLADKLLAM